MEDSIRRGYAEPISSSDVNRSDGAVWYLPHHAVMHPHKPDKVRIVFDCAARHQGVSLNDEVQQGPDLMNKLVGVLLRFRQESIGIMSDIEGMFNQVRVNKTDRDVLRFLWWPKGNLNEQRKIYRMTTHLFGGVWSPSCANFALKHTAVAHGAEFDERTVATVERCFYVDDCLASVSSEEVGIRLINSLSCWPWGDFT